MIVKFRDGTESILDNDRGNNLKQILASDNCPEYIEINDTLVRRDYIVKISPGGYTQADIIDNKFWLLDRPDHRGKASAAKEILRERFKNGKPT